MTQKDKMTQKIWCISTDRLFEKGKWQGLQTQDLGYYLHLFRKYGEFLPRGPLEEDDSYIQIISQIILKVGDKFLLHRITKQGSESKLHDLWPLFVGGHIDEEDNEFENLIEGSMEREFREEIDYKGNILKKTFLGLLYIDNENPVNKVHIGITYLFEGDSEEIETKEVKLADLDFVDIDYLKENINNLTYWSREIIPILPSLL